MTSEERLEISAKLEAEAMQYWKKAGTMIVAQLATILPTTVFMALEWNVWSEVSMFCGFTYAIAYFVYSSLASRRMNEAIAILQD